MNKTYIMKKSGIFLKRIYSSAWSRFFTVLLLLIFFTANSFSQPKSKLKPAVTKPFPQKSFIMCDVMPGPEVASKAPFTIPFKSAEAWPTAGIHTGCRYIFKSEDDEAGVSIALTDLGSTRNAWASYKNAFQASKDLWEETPASVIVLQDTGYFSGKDECGLKFHLGKYILDINFKGQFDSVSAEQKKEAGIALVKLIMERLKYLWENS